MSNLFYQTKSPRPTLDRAEGIYMWDSDGKRYIDGSSGAMVSNIGHSNPAVLEAMRAQMAKSTFGYRLHFQTESSEMLAARTAALAPDGLNKVFFVSGGSEAVESTLKMARQYALTQGQSQRFKVISRYPSYHGCTLGALAITGYAPMTAPFDPMMQRMPKVPAPRAYLDGLDADDPATGLHYANMLEAKILEEGPDTVLAFVVEPVGGASTGALVPPAGYLRRIREICTQYGVLLIHDEVMTGGYVPLGAMIARDDIVEAVMAGGGFVHGFTYAGNPLACAAGCAVLDQIEAHDLTGNAAGMGEKLAARLNGLMQRYPLIGDVRGKGLLMAFELMADRNTKAPLPSDLNAHARLVDIAYDNGLIIYSRRTRGGTSGDHFLVCPPMIVDEAQLDDITERLDRALASYMAEIPQFSGAV